MKTAFLTRDALVPYIYTVAYREAYIQARGLLSPVYYDYPEDDEAYSYETQYLFGPAFLIAPVTAAPHTTEPDGLTPKALWIPPGTWIDVLSGAVVQGPTTRNSSYTLAQTPVYARGGALVPMRPLAAQHETFLSCVQWRLFVGAANGAGELYEDDGTNVDYQRGVGALTTATYTRSSASNNSNTTLVLRIKAPVPAVVNGSIPSGLPAQRTHELQLAGVATMPQQCACSGTVLHHVVPDSGPGFWALPLNATATGSSMPVLVARCPASALHATVNIEIVM